MRFVSNFDPSGFRRNKADSDELAQRHARERELLDEARAEFDAGLTMDEDEVEAWLDALDSDEERPLPEVRSPGPTMGM